MRQASQTEVSCTVTLAGVVVVLVLELEIILTDCDDGTRGSLDVLRHAVDLGEFKSFGGGVFDFVTLSDSNGPRRF